MGAAALVLSSQRVEGPGRRRALPETLLGTSRAYLVDCTSEAHVRRMRETSEDPTLAEVATALAALFEEVRIVRPCAHTRPSLPPPRPPSRSLLGCLRMRLNVVHPFQADRAAVRRFRVSRCPRAP